MVGGVADWLAGWQIFLFFFGAEGASRALTRKLERCDF